MGGARICGRVHGRVDFRAKDELASSFRSELSVQSNGAAMQLIVGLRNSWKCVEVALKDGCLPVIGGVALSDCNIEPALWFKVSLAAGRNGKASQVKSFTVVCVTAFSAGSCPGLCVHRLYRARDYVGLHSTVAERRQ